MLLGFARDDRAWNGTVPPGVAFTYASGRGVQYTDCILHDFGAILHTDGYAGYDHLIELTRTSPASIAERRPSPHSCPLCHRGRYSRQRPRWPGRSGQPRSAPTSMRGDSAIISRAKSTNCFHGTLLPKWERNTAYGLVQLSAICQLAPSFSNLRWMTRIPAIGLGYQMTNASPDYL